MQFLVLSVVVIKIHCGWELYISELMDSSTFHLWKNSNNIPSSNLLLVCDLQPTLNSKILQGDVSLTRNILMSASRGFSKIRISFDIYYLGQWNLAEAITVYANSLLVHYENPNTSQLEDYPMRYCITRPFGKSNSEKISRIDQMIQQYINMYQQYHLMILNQILKLFMSKLLLVRPVIMEQQILYYT